MSENLWRFRDFRVIARALYKAYNLLDEPDEQIQDAVNLAVAIEENDDE